MEKQTTTLDVVVKISIIMGALLVALSIAYYLVIFLPQKENTRLEQQKQEQQVKVEEKKKAEDQKNTNEMMLDICLSGADTDYASFWNSECNSQGLGDDCILPQYNADRAEELKKNNRNDCFKQYPQ